MRKNPGTRLDTQHSHVETCANANVHTTQEPGAYTRTHTRTHTQVRTQSPANQQTRAEFTHQQSEERMQKQRDMLIPAQDEQCGNSVLVWLAITSRSSRIRSDQSMSYTMV